MPIKIPNNLPATNVLEGENVFVMNAARAYGQDIRPLRILILNLMPIKDVTETQRADVARVPELTVLAEGDAGVYIIANRRRRQFFITGHAEYDPMTLKAEYDRDLAAGLNPDIPCNYYPEDDPNRAPVVRWRSVAHLLFANWLNYYVYQGTPYELDSLDNADDWELHSGL